MCEAIIYNELVSILGRKNVSQDVLVRKAYSTDLSWIARSWARLHWPYPQPDYVVWTETAEQVSEILKLANRYKVPVVPYCGGAGIQGGTIPIRGGIVLDVKRMNKVVEIDERNLTVRTQTGLMGQELEWKLNAKGYTTAHLPQSSYCSGIGGYLAARSAGVLSTKYGKIADMVLGMEVVLPDGKIMRTRPVPRSAAGPNLNHLFLGAEGTLGVITEVTLAIHPLPEMRSFRAFVFPNLHTGMEAARKIMRKGLLPAAMRLSDEAETTSHYDQDGAFLIVHFDGFEDMVELEMSQAIRIALEGDGEDWGPEPGENWWNNRFKVAYPKEHGRNQLGNGKCYAGKVVDTAGSFDYLEAVHEEMKRAVTRIKGTTFLSHFSHWYKTGGMMYPRVYNFEVANEEQLADLHLQLVDCAVKAILKHGGTINHHHGIGLVLGRYMRDELGEGFEALQQIKRALDPNNIMNPGKLGFEL